MTLAQENGIEIYVALQNLIEFEKWLAVIKNNQNPTANNGNVN